MRQDCTAEIYCESCNMDNHKGSTCWRKDKARRARSISKDKSKPDKNKSGKKKRIVNETSATLSFSADEYSDESRSEGDSEKKEPEPTRKIMFQEGQ